MPSRGEEIFSFRHLHFSEWHWRCKLRKADKASGRTPLYMNPSCKAILRIFIVQYQCGNESISELRSPSGEREVKSVRHIFCEVLVLMKRNLGPGYEVSLSLRKVGSEMIPGLSPVTYYSFVVSYMMYSVFPLYYTRGP